MIVIDGFPMDLALSEGHSFPGEVTQYPVEQGADFSDHIRDLPEEIELECIVSDSPSGAIANDPTRKGEPGADGNTPLPSAAALEKLRLMKARRRPVSIETSLGVFTSMACIALDVPKDAARSNGLFFTATFKKINIVTNRRTKTPVRTSLAGAGGKAAPKAVAGTGMIVTNSVVIWNQGRPPGAPFRNGLSVRVAIKYSKPFGFTDDVLVAAGLSGLGSPLNEYTVVGEAAPVTGDRRRALVLDLQRDASNKKLAQLDGLSETLADSPFSRLKNKNLPPGKDLSRFSRPAPPPPPIFGAESVPLTPFPVP
jgi:hypothetical protein